MPTSAPLIWTMRWISSGCMLPQPSLMFMPLGWLCATATSAPSSRKTQGVDLYAAPFATSTATRISSRDIPFGKLDAVVLIGIMRCGEDDAGIGTQRASDVSNTGCRQRSDDEHIDSERSDS